MPGGEEKQVGKGRGQATGGGKAGTVKRFVEDYFNIGTRELPARNFSAREFFPSLQFEPWGFILKAFTTLGLGWVSA